MRGVTRRCWWKNDAGIPADDGVEVVLDRDGEPWVVSRTCDKWVHVSVDHADWSIPVMEQWPELVRHRGPMVESSAAEALDMVATRSVTESKLRIAAASVEQVEAAKPPEVWW